MDFRTETVTQPALNSVSEPLSRTDGVHYGKFAGASKVAGKVGGKLLEAPSERGRSHRIGVSGVWQLLAPLSRQVATDDHYP